MTDDDPLDLLPYYEPLRVSDVCDALDGIGYFNVGLMDREVRPLWPGMSFWGVAFTVRCVPANRPMWKLNSTEEIVRAHGIWFDEVGVVRYQDQIRKGHVIVNATGGGQEAGQWGSANSLSVIAAGAVGIITDGYCRDTDELILQQTPICSRERGRTIIPGRIEVVEVQTRVSCGGVQVAPGDIVGCDGDGIVVVPQSVAAEGATHSRAILIHDMKARLGLYGKLGMAFDATVDVAKMEAYFAELDSSQT